LDFKIEISRFYYPRCPNFGWLQKNIVAIKKSLMKVNVEFYFKIDSKR